MHAFVLEIGISLPIGIAVVRRLATVLSERQLPPRHVAVLDRLHSHFKYLEQQIIELDREIAHQLADSTRDRFTSLM
jgi:hypothetical protein